MLHMGILTIPIGGITLTLHGDLTPPAYVPPGAKPQFGSPSQSQQPPPSSPVEQAIVNLSKVVGNFVEEQKGINVQMAQIIYTVENTLNKKIDARA